MSFTFKELDIPGLIVIKPKVFGDERGYFLETYHARDFAKLGIDATFVQDNQSKSVRGVLRGLHFQRKYAQGKIVRAPECEVIHTAVELRYNSPIFHTLGERQPEVLCSDRILDSIDILVLSTTAIFGTTSAATSTVPKTKMASAA